jgi:hypothetical protein
LPRANDKEEVVAGKKKSGETERERRKKEERRNFAIALFSALLFVPRTGIEPAHPCEWQILSLLRLPIPPPGLMIPGSNISQLRIALQNTIEIFFFYRLSLPLSFSALSFSLRSRSASPL